MSGAREPGRPTRTDPAASGPVHIILNPTAGGGVGARRRARFEQALAAREVSIELECTTAPGHAVALARGAVESGAGAVIAAGGDGTVHEVANGMLDAHESGRPLPALGAVPVGSGNDFAKLLGTATDIRRVLDLAQAGSTRPFDVGRVRWRDGEEYFINGMGTGIDVEVVRRRERLPHMPGALSYLSALLRTLVDFRAAPLRLALDGAPLERTAMILAVGNGTCIGGGFYVCPDARPDDGRFDVCVIKEVNLAGVARILPRVLRGTHGRFPEVETRRAQTIQIERTDEEPLLFQLDGELREAGRGERVRVELCPAALPVLAAPAPLPSDDPSAAHETTPARSRR